MKKYGAAALICIVGIFFGKELLHPGFMQTHDGIWHVERILNMATMLTSGVFPVRWSYNLDNGFGIPLFNFAYPGPYYVMAIAHLAGLGVNAVYSVTTLGLYLLGGLGMYALLRKKSEKGAAVAAILYLLTPYQFLDIFVRGALGEVAVLGLFPWCLYMVELLENKKKIVWFSPIPLFFVLISHNFLGLVAIGLITVLTLLGYRQKRVIFMHMILAAGLAAFFLIPMIGERKLLMDSPPGNQNAQFDRHYVMPRQLIWDSWGYTGSLPGDDPVEISYQLGLANILLIVYAALYTRRQAGVYLTLIAVSVFMMTPASSFIWEAVPILQIIQFPWRLLAVTAILVPLVFIHVYIQAEKESKNRATVIAGLCLVIAILNVYGYTRPERRLSPDEFGTLHAVYAEKTATAYRYELMPRWAAEERDKPGVLTVSSGGVAVSEASEEPYRIRFTALSRGGGSVTVYRNYYPAWKGRVDGEPLTLTPTPTGEIMVPVSEGTHTYEVWLGSTPLAMMGNGVTLLAIAGTILIWRKNG